MQLYKRQTNLNIKSADSQHVTKWVEQLSWQCISLALISGGLVRNIIDSIWKVWCPLYLAASGEDIVYRLKRRTVQGGGGK